MKPSKSNVVQLPRKLTPAESACARDIRDICKAENIPLRFGMAHYHSLLPMYRQAYETRH